MGVAEARGRLGHEFTNGWTPGRGELLELVLKENRRWCAVHGRDVLKDMELVPAADGRLDCRESIRKAVGLNYTQMVELADKAKFRAALDQMGKAVADMFEATQRRSPRMANLPAAGPSVLADLRRSWGRQ